MSLKFRLNKVFAYLVVLLSLLVIAASLGYIALSYNAGLELSKLDAISKQSSFAPEPDKITLAPGIYALSTTLEEPFPLNQTNPTFWSNPNLAQELGYDSISSQGFSPIIWSSLPRTETNGTPLRIRIPAINLESTIKELAVEDFGSSKAYETPKDIVGHIPGTAAPGDIGNGWYFGHLESLIRGEGSVFSELPRIPSLLRTGENIYVILDSADGSYLYRITGTTVLKEDDLHMYDSTGYDITLVTCVPKFKYDHRLLVNARLVGVQW